MCFAPSSCVLPTQFYFARRYVSDKRKYDTGINLHIQQSAAGMHLEVPGYSPVAIISYQGGPA